MSVSTMSTFAAVLALLALSGTIVALVVLAIARRATAGDGVRVFRDDLRNAALPLAFLVALTGTAGSLYFSEIAHFVPCQLCWFQRICLYPLTLLLGIAAWRRDTNIRPYVSAQAGVGLAIALYHAWIQAFPPVGGSSFCTAAAPCTERYVWQFGFVSLPFMAACAFGAILAAMAVAAPARERRRTPARTAPSRTADLGTTRRAAVSSSLTSPVPRPVEVTR